MTEKDQDSVNFYRFELLKLFHFLEEDKLIQLDNNKTFFFIIQTIPFWRRVFNQIEADSLEAKSILFVKGS